MDSPETVLGHQDPRKDHEARPAVHSAADLHVGLTASYEREINETDVLEFARSSGDFNPLHTDAEYARSTNLGARVVHGAYQVALASAMAGMHLPGKNSFLVSYNAQFLRPLYFPCRVSVRGEITAWDPTNSRGALKVSIAELPSGAVSSQIHVGFTCHENATQNAAAVAAERPAKAIAPPSPAAQLAANPATKLILITGASGGIGSYLAQELAQDYSIAAVVNRSALPSELATHKNVRQLNIDLSESESVTRIEEMLQGRCLFAIIHAAWPGLLRGGLLSVPRHALEQQLSFAVHRTIELARLLSSNRDTGGDGNEGARLIVLGSTAGTQKPSLNTAAYSLAKAALEHAVKLLAPELALKKITVNAICPSFLPTGMNAQTNQRQRLAAAAAVPMGRLCETSDVLATLRFLLSPNASFLTGQTIVLSGGQL
jgi:NAD(P)-dependent dehydrogenase (short-subunit alcohol dehydrogenase family)/acyl dehydratase